MKNNGIEQEKNINSKRAMPVVVSSVVKLCPKNARYGTLNGIKTNQRGI